jgi:hypothetical protein
VTVKECDAGDALRERVTAARAEYEAAMRGLHDAWAHWRACHARDLVNARRAVTAAESRFQGAVSRLKRAETGARERE